MLEPVLRVSRIDHVAVLVDDMDRALAFYEGVLACEVEARLPHLGMVDLQAGSCHITLVDVSAAEGASAAHPGGRNVDHIGLSVTARSEGDVRAHLARHGVAIVEEREEQAGGGKALSFYVHDPAHNTIELILSV
ncbi:MAG: VOC family protein [Candidatus Eremiobacteraeota bacterium]|nr:VOC family protein [Candidatus Eremiobacteraeota bacterium]